MTKLSTKLKEEFFELLPPTIFFFVALPIVAFVRVLMLKGTGISPLSSMSVAVADVILGKAALIADMVPNDQSLSKQTADLQRRLENLDLPAGGHAHSLSGASVVFWRQTGGFVAGNKKLLAEIVWPHFWVIQIILLVLIAMYCTMHELVRVIGKEKVLRIFFGPMPFPEV